MTLDDCGYLGYDLRRLWLSALFPANMLMFLANLSIYLVYPGNTTKDHVFQANLDKDYYVSR
jgi:hypothetical protein